MKVAIIGMGLMGSKYANMILENDLGLELIASTRINEENYLKLKVKLPADFKIYYSDKELFEAYDNKELDIEGVIVVTPHYQHPVSVNEALKRNLEILCDKPAAVKLEDARIIYDNSKGINFCYIFQHRKYESTILLKRIIEGESFGKVKRFSYVMTDWYRTNSYYKGAKWRGSYTLDGGGLMLNQCPHSLDLLYNLFGMPSFISGIAGEGKYHDITVEDDVTMLMSYENGVTGSFISSTGELPAINRLEIVFDKALVKMEDGVITIKELPHKEEYYRNIDLGWTEFKVDEPTITTLAYKNEPKEAYLETLKAFANKRPTANAYDGIGSLYMANALYLSSWTKKGIEIYPLGSEEELKFERDFECELNKRIEMEKLR